MQIVMKAVYASNPQKSQGRKYPELGLLYRTEFQRDRDRIIHSTAFRRLEYKTQVFVNHEGDLYRTRLTHSIEVAQIARSIARMMHLDEDLSEAIALAHDLGHTPFGHAGQDALNTCMKPYGGFEHNLQSLRVVDVLEQSYADFSGLNLTFEAREGILKHCSIKHAKDLGDVGKRFINKTQPSLEAQLVNLADEIAYNNHDIDDGIRSGLITVEQLLEVELFAQSHSEVMYKYPKLSGRKVVHETLRRIINRMITDLLENSQQQINENNIQTLEDVRNHSNRLMQYSLEMKQLNQTLKRFLRENLYYHHCVYRMTNRAQQTVQGLFDVFINDERLLPPKYQKNIKKAEKINGIEGRAEVIADYIAGMTDRYATEEYKRLFV